MCTLKLWLNLLVAGVVSGDPGLSGVWNNIVVQAAKLPQQTTHKPTAQMDSEAFQHKIRLEVMKEVFLSKLGLTEPPVIKAKTDWPQYVKFSNILQSTVNTTMYEVQDRKIFNFETDKVLVLPKDLYCVQRENTFDIHLKLDLPTHLQAEDVIFVSLSIHSKIAVENFSKYCYFESSLCEDGRTAELIVNNATENDGWLKLDISWTLKNWLEYRKLCHDIKIRCTFPNDVPYECPISMIPEYEPYLLVKWDSSLNTNRGKRNTKCMEGMTECCRENLYISFKDINWNEWIVEPAGFHANYCKGSCSRATSITLNTYYTIIEKMKKNNSQRLEMYPCCAATQFSSMSVIYKLNESTMIHKKVPDMVVESCGCI